MKKQYRGFELEAFRDKSLSGAEMIFYSIFRDDGWELDSGSSYADETLREFMGGLEVAVDDYYENPEDFED